MGGVYAQSQANLNRLRHGFKKKFWRIWHTIFEWKLFINERRENVIEYSDIFMYQSSEILIMGLLSVRTKAMTLFFLMYHLLGRCYVTGEIYKQMRSWY
jgi:hypothetical protein